MQETAKQKHDMQQLIGNTLRIGVTIACLIALVGGMIYLARHGSEPMKDYSHFSYTDASFHPSEYTTLSGIFSGLGSLTAYSWIQLGVLALILTPIMRVVMSLLDFAREHDWLYCAITATVLAIIIANSLGAF